MMNLEQTKLIGLTMELELKTIEYKKLCKKLETLKQRDVETSDEELKKLQYLFEKNHSEIVNINRQLKELKFIQE